MYTDQGEYIRNRGLLSMDSIKDLLEIWKNQTSLLAFEEEATAYMYQFMRRSVEQVFSLLDQAITREKQAEGWKVDSHKDQRILQFLFGPVTLYHTRMINPEGHACYPLDNLLRLRKHMRYSPNVEYETATLASRMTCREVVKTLATWTQVQMSHTTVMRCVRAVGEAQEKQDQELVIQAENGELDGKRQPNFLFAEADGTFVRGLKKRQHIEIKHFILYEGWVKNGKRRLLKEPYAVMTSKGLDTFWEQVGAAVEQRYRLWQTQVVANSDGGVGYDEAHFKDAFCGSHKRIWVQLDAFHVAQSLIRSLHGDKAWITRIQQAIQRKDRTEVILLLDTYESNLDEDERIKQVEKVKQYLIGHWDRLFDWREIMAKETLPENAGRLGAMESNQRHLTFRMKKRGMHWGESEEGMVKVIQGIRNGTLKAAYLSSFIPTKRDERIIKKMIRIASLLKEPTVPSIGAHRGRIGTNASSSSAVGKLNKVLTFA
ncbi:ISLre2 family transposase [Sporolactobacillus terrae]|uniref:ISLre2 family transposase n=7 Tax=Sporolactobacillus terrae TaxID=269673 RepID=A0A410D9N9_9BACL|nr:ISLre2 family transposase [Sporolactobacillus terrae]QAA22704.1 ISLre2 family transposase [Sporolactobacillus terrae]QAA22817.1 ISLre2 family transposase [Sporolactobacillus terrae]QAA24873.1 ISLre2 family transposase [Sporolactobacillus terrae]QAA25283.1 ISLre2 family transposase [Sporolactobacillus terrae]